LHHPIFDKFQPFSGDVPLGFTHDYIGSISHQQLFKVAPPHVPHVTADLPPIDEEYFEWIDVLESVFDSGDSYTIFELGAGYGRWSARAAVASRQRGIKNINIVAVEPEPRHFQFLEDHMRHNSISEKDCTLFQAAVGPKQGLTALYIDKPNLKNEDNFDLARDWYGQYIVDDPDGLALLDDRKLRKILYHSSKWQVTENSDFQETYEGFEVINFNHPGVKAIEIEQTTLELLLTNYDFVNLVDMDIQGAEFDVIKSSARQIDQKVKRLHIGTHSTEVEENLYSLLSNLGWKCLNNYPFQSQVSTPFGDIIFGDGVQSWINPKI